MEQNNEIEKALLLVKKLDEDPSDKEAMNSLLAQLALIRKQIEDEPE